MSGLAKNSSGFSLIEMVIVVAMMAVLVILAVPAYKSQATRANRVMAITALFGAASCQERLRAVESSYDTGRCLPNDDRNYHYVYAPVSTEFSGRRYALVATPQGVQTTDHCGWLKIDERGNKTSESGNDRNTKCWEAR